MCSEELVKVVGEGLGIAHVGEELVCGNTDGIHLLDKLEEHNELLSRHEDSIKELTATIKRFDAAPQQSQKEIASMKQSSRTYTKMRERFFATYKRDNFRDRMIGNDWKCIRDGSSAAHHGDLS